MLSLVQQISRRHQNIRRAGAKLFLIYFRFHISAVLRCHCRHHRSSDGGGGQIPCTDAVEDKANPHQTSQHRVSLRLTNSSDQEHVGRFLPDSLSGLTRILSSLSRREATFVGEGAALPSRIRIRELDKNQLPDSADIKFAEGWAQDPMQQPAISNITKRWLGF